MISLQYPKINFQISRHQGKDFIFDPVRKKSVLLSPEEWVRQHIIHYLAIRKNYPMSLMSVEKQVNLGELKKRCDIVIYDRNAIPWMIIECKKMEVGLEERILDQVIRYNMALPVKYLVMTNGTSACCMELPGLKDQVFLEDFPDFE
ncbi:MAG TPA: type I restriction enzyme HsdR N-terminal domain-containing protein [Chitinophagaceae bacterium]|nr:type I restriction enzyme HsdR N-terminal domain-containing protein [Chitinophagaceae bacterium]